MSNNKPRPPGVILARPRAGMGVGPSRALVAGLVEAGGGLRLDRWACRAADWSRSWTTAPAAPWYRWFDNR